MEVYGRKKRDVAYNRQGQRVGRPHVASWAEAEIVLAADLGDGTDDPRATAPDLLRRALAALPPRARASGRVAMRADAGYFAGALARAAHDAKIAFAIGAGRVLEQVQLRHHACGGDHVGEGVGLAFCVEAGLLGASLDMAADDRVAALRGTFRQVYLVVEASVDCGTPRVRKHIRDGDAELIANLVNHSLGLLAIVGVCADLVDAVQCHP